MSSGHHSGTMRIHVPAGRTPGQLNRELLRGSRWHRPRLSSSRTNDQENALHRDGRIACAKPGHTTRVKHDAWDLPPMARAGKFTHEGSGRRKQILNGAVQRPRLNPPEGSQPVRINRLNAAALLLYHAVAALAVWPWLFSWWGIAAALFGMYVFGTLGINLCYHRLLTHRRLICPRWLEHMLAILGVCSFQDTPARWAAVHRRHHEHPDERSDPHTPLVSFFWRICNGFTLRIAN